ncbi:MAG: hypothetical protein F6K31_25980 [Symploca sp. SIO2G7]|nr:hypothetical protein [Symploca sp. SIO2G7]
MLFVICHLLFVICHLLSVTMINNYGNYLICKLHPAFFPIPNSPFPIPHSPFPKTGNFAPCESEKRYIMTNDQ